MQIEMLAILITGILNLLATLRQSRCTEIDSECCCIKFHVNRELKAPISAESSSQNDNNNIV